MVGSHEADDNRLTGRVARGPRPRPTDHLPVVEDGSVADPEAEVEAEAEAGATSGTDQPVAPAEPELETVTKLMGFLRSSDG
jgi:hypothetical protein